MRIRTTLKRFFIVLLFLLLIAGIGVGVYIYINKPEAITDFLKSNDAKEEDFKNGIYSYERQLDKSYRVFDGCNVYAIYNYLAVMGDTYKYYESSCLKTSLIKSGKVDELEFSLNEDNKYEVKYDDKVLEKDGKITSIIVSEDISSKFRSSNFEAIEFVIKEAEKEGSYFNFETAIAGSGSNYKFYFSYLEDVKKFKIELTSSSNLVYTKTLDSLDILPEFYETNGKIAIIDPIKQDNKFYYKLLVYNNNELIYNLDNKLPLIVNGVTLNNTNSIYISLDSKKDFDLLIGYDDKFCDDSKKEGISFYHFKIAYDYKKNNFAIPEYVKTGYYKDGCSYVNKIMKG